MPKKNDKTQLRRRNTELQKLVAQLEDKITKQKQAEKEQLEAVKKWKSTFDAMSDSVCIIDLDGHVLEYNSTTMEMLGVSDKIIKRKHCWELFHGQSKPLENCPLERLKISMKKESIIFERKNAWLEVSVDPIFDDSGELKGAVHQVSDITEQKQLEDELLLKNEVFKASITANSTSDKEGNLTYVNRAFLRIFGYECTEAAVGKPIGDFLKFEDEAMNIIAALDATEEWEGEYTGLRLDGTTFDAYGMATVIKDTLGKIIGYQSAVVDISESKQMQKTLRESEEKYSSVVENCTDGILVLQNGVIKFLNRAITDLTGYDSTELIDRGFEEFIPEQYRKLIIEKYQICLSGKEIPSTHEMDIIKKDGTAVPIEASISIMTYEGKEAILCFVRDITQHRESEAALVEKEKYFRTVLHNLHEDILIIGPDYRILDVNNKFVRTTGHSREDAIGRYCYEVSHGYDIPCHEMGHDCCLMKVFDTGEVFTSRHIYKSSDGTPVDVNVLLSPIKDAEGNVTRVIEAVRDITKEVKLEAQLYQAQKMESVGRLAGGVAHDFNNMLSVILGHSEMALEQMNRSNPLFDGLHEIRKAAERSADLTRQLLAFARKQQVTPMVLELNETVEGILNMLRRLIGEGIDLNWMPGPDIWPVKLDPSQIDQILANLCVNARDAIENVGKITIQTRNSVLHETYFTDYPDFIPGKYVILTVSDDGCGMEQETLDKLFEPFFTTKVTGKGTGLGLATVYGIVKQNNGFINVQSKPGHGSTFNIYFKRHTPGTAAVKKESTSESIEHGDETILLVEDESTILKITSMMLEHLGYTVLTASSPEEAIRMAGEKSGEIHLLITDVVMPGMNGRDLAIKLQSIYPHIRQLYMSGYTSNIIADHGVLYEGVHFLQKPFTNQKLSSKVREALNSE